MTSDFQRLLRLQHLTEAAIRNAQTELDGIKGALVALSGLKVGDIIPKYDREPNGQQVRINSIHADVIFVDDIGQAFLRVQGSCTPITKSGQPHKAIRWELWSRVITRVAITIDEYKALVAKVES